MDPLMRRLFTLAALTALAASLAAQTPPPNGPPMMGPGGQRFAPPPDHWMTMDSLVEALGLSADQKTKIAQPYTALNGVLKQAADRRAELRRRFAAERGGQQGPMSPAEMTPEQRARMDSVRAEFDGMQEEADQWYQTIRAAL